MRRWKNIAREKINYLVCNSGDIGDEFHYTCIYFVMKFVSDLRQVGGFPRGLPVSSTNKTDL